MYGNWGNCNDCNLTISKCVDISCSSHCTMHSASSLFIYVLSENNGVSLLYLWIESTGSPLKILKLGYKFGFINDRYIIRTHTSLRMACVLCLFYAAGVFYPEEKES